MAYSGESMSRTFAVSIGGAAGQGVATPGDIFARIFSRRGLHVNAYNAYQSIIRGGHTFLTIRTGPEQVTNFGDRKKNEGELDMRRHSIAAFAFLMMARVSLTASGQGNPDPATLIKAERESMVPLANLDGVWRGPAWTLLSSGEKHNITQTERIGPLLDGSIKVIEGRGYELDGTVEFNAFAIISYDPAKRTYTMHSHTRGQVGDFVLKPTADGFVWEIPAGPVTIRYTVVIKNGTWQEVGDQIMPGKEPVRFFEMNLKRVSDSTWPAAGAVPPK
jgi:hypothetical protein